MKVERNKTAPVFEPIQVTLTIESSDELDTLYAMTKLTVSIPEVVVNSAYGVPMENKLIVQDFLISLREALDLSA